MQESTTPEQPEVQAAPPSAPAIAPAVTPEPAVAAAPQVPAVPAVPAVTGPPAGRPWILAAAIALFAVLAFWNAARRELWGREAAEALTIREMEASLETATGWLVPTRGGVPYLSRPPLAYWPAALLNRIPLPGLDEADRPLVTYRLPALLSAILSLWLTWRLAKRLFDDRTAVVAVAVQATGCLFFVEAAWLSADIQFAALAQLSVTGLALASAGPPSWRHHAAALVGLCGASLTLSPVLAFTAVLCPFVLFLLWSGGLGNVFRGLAAVRGRRLALGFLLITSPWYVYAALAHGPALLEQHVIGEHWGRLSASVEDAQPPYFYLWTLVVSFLPWSLFVPGGWYHGKDRLHLPGRCLAMVWSIFLLVLLSLVASKRVEHLLVLWPPIALLVAAALVERDRRFSLYESYLTRGFFRIVPVLLKAPLCFAVAAGAAWYFGLHEKLDSPHLRALGYMDLLADSTLVQGHLALAVVGGAAAFVTAGRVRGLVAADEIRRASLELACAAIFLLFVASFLLPAFNRVGSARHFLDIVQTTTAGRPLATYGQEHHSEVLYYLGQRVGKLDDLVPLSTPGSAEAARREELDAYLRGDEPVFLLLSTRKLEGLRTQFSGIHARLAETGVSGSLGTPEEFRLVTNKR